MDRCLFLCPFSFDLSVICPSSTYGFWYLRTVLTLTCLKGAMLSVHENKPRFNMKILCYTTIYGMCEFDNTYIMHEHIDVNLVHKAERLENLWNWKLSRKILINFWFTVWNRHLQNCYLVKDIAAFGIDFFKTNKCISCD